MKRLRTAVAALTSAIIIFTVSSPCVLAQTGASQNGEPSQIAPQVTIPDNQVTPRDENGAPNAYESTDDTIKPGVSNIANPVVTEEPTATMQESSAVPAETLQHGTSSVEPTQKGLSMAGASESEHTAVPTSEPTAAAPTFEATQISTEQPFQIESSFDTYSHAPEPTKEVESEPTPSPTPEPTQTIQEPAESQIPLPEPTQLSESMQMPSASATDEPKVIPLQSNTGAGELAHALEIAWTDGQKAAVILNANEANSEYQTVLNKILTLYYTEELVEQRDTFLSFIGLNAKPLCQKYADAAAERAKAPEELGYVPGEVIVMLKDGSIDPEQIVKQYSCIGYEEIAPARLTRFGDTGVFKIPVSETVNSAITLFRQNPAVKFAEPNSVTEIEPPEPEMSAFSLQPKNDPENQWYLDEVKAREAWDIIKNIPHDKVKVAVIDTGVDVNHPDLQKNLIKSLCVNATTDSLSLSDTDGTSHGTKVCGLIGATSNNNIGIAGVGTGVNNDIVDVMSARTSNGGSLIQSAITRSIYWAIDNDAKVINMSLGDHSGFSQEKIALEAAYDAGITLIASAGNDNISGDYFPSDYDTVISVIATDAAKNKADFSNYGVKKDISAPGVNLKTTAPGGGYMNFSGTSGSAPIVSAIVAMMYSVNPSITPAQVKDIIINTAVDINTPGFDIYTANGLVDAYAAVKAALQLKGGAAPEPEKPGTPQLVRALYQTDSQALISWKRTESTDMYEIHRSINGGSYTLIGSSAGVSYTDINITANNTYSYKIKAYRKIGQNKLYGEFSQAAPYKSSNLTAPANFSIYGAGVNRLNCSWNAVSGADGYEIVYVTVDDEPIKSIYASDGTSFTITGLTECTLYKYRICAYEDSAIGRIYGRPVFTWGTTNAASATAPKAPANLNAEVIKLEYPSFFNEYAVSLTWDAVPGAAGYIIWIFDDKGATIDVITEDVFTPFYYIVVPGGKKCRIMVRGYKYMNGIELNGEPAWVDTPELPERPILTEAVYRDKKVTLKWDAVPGASGYEVYRSVSDWGNYERIDTVTSTTYTDAAPLNKKTSYYAVRAFRYEGLEKIYGGLGTYKEVETTQTLAAPAYFTAKALPGCVYVAWESVQNAAGYEITRSTDKNFDSQVSTFDVPGSVVNTYEDYRVDPGMKYWYKVCAYTEIGGVKEYGLYSQVVSSPPKPAKPEGLSASVSGNKVTLKWYSVTNAAGYEVYRAKDSGVYTLVGSTDTISYIDTVPESNARYYYKVCAYSRDGTEKAYGFYSSYASAVVSSLGAPENVRADIWYDDGVCISWDAVPGAYSYRIERSSDGLNFTKLDRTITTNYTDKNIYRSYYYRVYSYSNTNVQGPVSVAVRCVPRAYYISSFKCGVNSDGTVNITDYIGVDTELIAPSEVSGRKVKEFLVPLSSLRLAVTSLTLPDTVTHLYGDILKDCATLKSITLPKALTHIDDGAFSNCRNLETLTLPKKLEYLGDNVLSGCSSLKTLKFMGDAPVGGNSLGAANADFVTLYTPGAKGFSDTWRGSPALVDANDIETPQNVGVNTGADTSIGLTWKAVPYADGYELLRSTDGSGFISAGTTSGTSFEDKNITRGIKYYYEVHAYIECGGVKIYGGFSDIVNAKVDEVSKPIISPSPSVSAATSASHTQNESAEPNVSSTPNVNTLTSTPTSLATSTQDSESSPSPNTTISPNVTPAPAPELTPAPNVVPNEPTTPTPEPAPTNNPGAIQTVVPDALPAASAVMTAEFKAGKTKVSSFKVVSAGYNSAKLTWNSVAGAKGYEVYRSTSNKNYKLVATTVKNILTNKALKTNTKYYYKVRPYKLSGNKRIYGAYTAPVTVKPTPVVPAKMNVKASAKSSVLITWSKTAGAAGYEVYYSTNGKSFKLAYRAAGSGKVTYSHAKLKEGKYYYKVRAYINSGKIRVYSAFTPVKTVGVKSI